MSRSAAENRRRYPLWVRPIVALAALVAVGSLALSLCVTGWAKFLHHNAQVVAVTSNSMVPAFEARDVLAVQPVDPATLKIGDVVTVRRPNGVMVTHRVVSLDNSGTAAVVIHTKGDANKTEDYDTAVGAQIVGKVTGQIPQIAPALLWVQSPRGRMITLAPVFVLIVIAEVADLWRREDEPTTGDPITGEPATGELSANRLPVLAPPAPAEGTVRTRGRHRAASKKDLKNATRAEQTATTPSGSSTPLVVSAERLPMLPSAPLAIEAAPVVEAH